MKKLSLTRGKVALLDDDDFEVVNKWKWCASEHTNTFYAVRFVRINGRNKVIYLHRSLLDAPQGLEVDHKDHSGLNCQRSNLRLCTRQENSRNCKKHPSRYSSLKGVSFDKNRQLWITSIRLKRGQTMALGRFKTEKEAHRAYKNAVKKYHGDFAPL